MVSLCATGVLAGLFVPQLAVYFFTSLLGLLAQVLVEAQHKVCLLWQNHDLLASSMDCAHALTLQEPNAASTWVLMKVLQLPYFSRTPQPSPGTCLAWNDCQAHAEFAASAELEHSGFYVSTYTGWCRWLPESIWLMS